ncbi:hypothetical protein EDB83DRAFT_2551278 [Lactarius deliciosus]|nr:hypothetical protein EDB83DRAFT_2551278 [Lactarius deliciosus]
MDLNPPSPSNHNAVAGPSSVPLNSSFFLLPSDSPRSPQLLDSTQDLISRFHLLSAYDKFTDDEGRDGKKKKNTYRHLIKGVPGKHSIKKDDFLTTIIQVPPKQHIPITPFDSRTQSEAFAVSLEGLKGWNIHALVPESTQAREDRKKRKELKKLAKAQGSTLPLLAGTPLASTPAAAPTPTQSHSQPPRTSTPVPLPRGVKREFDDSSVAQPNTQGPGVTAVNGSGGVTPTSVQVQRPGAAKAGVPGARPRPVKKQRVDVQGQARDIHPLPPMQQPTPQGV